LRLKPSPGLSINGVLDPSTSAAVLVLQRAAGVNADGVVGKDTWRVLHEGRVFAQGGAPVNAGWLLPAPSSPSKVLTWPATKKFEEMVWHALNKLPGSMRQELLGLISPASIAITLGIWAASQLTGVGEVVDVALLGLGAYMLGTAVLSVMQDMSHALMLTYNASSEKDLDEAAGLLAHVISVIGVATLVALLAKVRIGRGGAAAGEAATTEAAAPAAARNLSRGSPPGSAAGEAPLAEPVTAKPTTAKSTAPNEKTYARPSGYRKGVREKVWENAKASDGNVYDPVTSQKMDLDEPWDMGHKPGYEYRKHQASAAEREISRQQFLDEHNDPSHYRPELPSSNRSHKGEDVTDDYFGD
jgi:hypothetical protein